MSANTNLGNTPVNQGYVQLIHTGETGGIDGTLRTLYDGDGTASDLQIASNKVKVSTTLYIGSDTLQEYIQDTVGAMLVTNASHTNLSAAYDDAGDGAIDLTASGDVTLTNTVTLSNKTLTAPTLTGTTQGASITLSGDLTVNGTTTTVNQTNLDVSDNIIGLNRGASSNANDSGLIIERGSTGDNVFIGWDESLDRIRFATTSSDASSTGDLSLTNANIHAGRLYANVTGDVTGDVTGNADTATKIASITNSDIVQLTSSQTLTNKTLTSPIIDSVTISTIQTGSESFADNDTSLMTSAAIQDKITSYGYVTSSGISFDGSTANGVLTFKDSDEATVESNLTFDGTHLYLPDSSNIKFGDSQDLEIKHDGSNSIIKADGTGDLTIRQDTADKDILLRCDDGSGGIATYITLDGSAGFTTVQKLMRFEDDVDARFGSSSDLRIRHDGTDSKIDNYTGTLKIRNTVDDADITLESDNGSGGVTPYLTLDGSAGHLNLTPPNNVGIGTSSPRLPLHVASPDGDDDPADSSATGALLVTNSAASYGIEMGVSSSGDGWIQSHSVINSNEYNLNLNPIGGNIGVGTSSPSSYRLQFGNAGDKIGVDLSSGGTTRIAEIEFYNGSDGSMKLKTDNASSGGIEFHTEGSQRMEVLRGGNVHINNKLGIGLTSPASPLNVKSNSTSSSDSGITITQNGGSNAIFKMAEKSTDGGRFHMYDGGVEKIAFYTDGTANHISAGNVGIGVSDPSTKLEIAGHTRISGVGNALRFDTTGSEESNIIATINDYETLIATNRGSAGFGVIGNADIRFGFGTNYNAAETDLYINPNGRVGIGETSVDAKLHLTTASSGLINQKFESAGSSAWRIGIPAGQTYFAFDDSSDDLSSPEIIMDTDGRLVVGATAAIANVAGTGHFQVLGTGGGDSTITIGRFSNNSSPPTLAFSKSRNGTIGSNTIVQDGDNLGQIVFSASDGSDMICNAAKIEAEVDGTPGSNDMPGRLGFYTTADGGTGAVEALRIDCTQDAHFDQDVIAFSSTPSDIRLKKNFTKIDNGLDVVSKLEGHTFNWKKGGERLSAGFKAQEVEKILPHLVDEKKLPLKADDDKEYKILRYEEMIPYLVEAIKEQQEEIELLKANLDQVKYNRR